MTDSLGVLAATWGVLMALAPALQIARILERRASDDISISYLLVLEVGFMLWIVYGASLGNPAIIVPNSVAFSTGLLTIGVALRFRTHEAA